MFISKETPQMLIINFLIINKFYCIYINYIYYPITTHSCPLMISTSPPKFEVNIDVPQEHQYSFQSIFAYIKKKLQIKNSRKSNIDSVLKKCKGKFFKAIHDAIKLCLNLIVKRIPQKFITNITIEFNQNAFNKKIIDIYHEYNLLPEIGEILEKKLLRKGKEEMFKEIANSNYQQLYEVYIKSERYKADNEKIKKKEGSKIATLCDFVAKNFTKYYLYGKAHIQKEKEEEEDSKDEKEAKDPKDQNISSKKKVVFIVNDPNEDMVQSKEIQSNIFD